MIDPRTLINKQNTTQTQSTTKTGMIDPRTMKQAQPSTPVFKTLQEAQNYAKQNNLNVAGKVNTPNIPGITKPSIVENTTANALNEINRNAKNINQPFEIPQVDNVSAGDLTVIPQEVANVVNDYYEKRAEFLPQIGRNVTSGVVVGLTNAYDYGKGIIRNLEQRSKNTYGLSKALLGDLEGAEQTWQEAQKEATEKLEKDRQKTQWARDYNKYVLEQNQGYNGLAKGLLNASNVAGNMFGTSPAGTIGLFANAAGAGYNQALDEGASQGKAIQYGTASGALETAIETLSGGASQKLLNVPTINKISRFTDKIKNPGIKFVTNVAGDVLGEGIEESVSALLDPYIQKITYNPEAGYNSISEALTSMGNSFTESILPTLVMGGTSTVISGTNSLVNKQINVINASNLSQNEKQSLINQVEQKAEQIIKTSQQNVASQSLNTQETNQTNEVVPPQQQNQNMTNMVSNNTDTQKNDANIEQISQNNVGNAPNLQNTVKNDNKLFREGLEKFKKREYTDEDDLVLLDRPPEYFYNLGYDSNEKIVINMKKLEETMREPKGTFDDVNQHGITYDVVEQLPEAINNPLNIIKNPKFRNRFVLITSLTDQYGDIVIVPIEMNTKGRVIRVNTVYGKEFYDLKKTENIQSYMERNKDNIVYDIDNDIKKRSLTTSVHPGLQLPNVTDSSASINNIIQPAQNYVNNQENILASIEQLKAQDSKQGEEAYNTLNMKKPKLEQLAELTEEQAELPTGSYKQKADKNTPYRRKFWDNVESSKIIGQDIKEQVNMTNYERKNNDDTLNKMKERLDTDPVRVTQEWWAKDIKKATDQDVALGAILLERYQAEGKIEEAVDVVEKLADMGTEAGRTVQMYSIFQRLTPEGMQLYQQRKLNSALETLTKKQTGKWVEQNKDKFKLTEDDATFITAKVQEAQNAPTERQKQIALAEIEKHINDKLPPEAGQSIKAFRRIAMLFNPKTQVRNVVGNVTVMPLNYVTDLVSTGIDKAIAKKTGVRTTTLPSVKTIAKGAGKGLAETWDDYKKGIRTTPTGTKYEIQNNVKSFNENTRSKTLNWVNNKLNVIDRILSSVMEAGDRPFYEAAYQNSLQGQMKANGVTEPTQEMIDIASNVALSQTWQDNNNYTQAVLGIRSAFNKININGFGLGDLIIPFAKTPANLTKAMVDYSPAGFIPAIINYNDMRKAISRGDMTAMQQKKFVTSVGKAVAGTVLYTLAGALVKGGAVTGSADEDKDVANFEKNVLGIQPYSIKLGDKTFTYNWAQPLATPLAIMSDAYKMSAEDAKLNEILVNSFKVAGDQLVANSFLQGIQELLSSEYGDESAMDNLVGAIMDLPTQFTPTFLGQIATYIDPTKRQTFENGDSVGTMWNEVKNKIPGTKNTLAPQVNTFGEEIQNYGGDNSGFNVFLNPANVSSTNATETQKELYALYEATKDKTIFPRQAPYSVSGGGEKVVLSSRDRAEYQKTSGQYVTEHLDALFDSEFYKTLDDSKKVEVVAKIISDADTTAKDKWLDTESTEKLAELQTELQESGIPLVDYYNAWIAQKGIKGDTNKFTGKTISGSKKKNQITEINKAVSDDLTKKQKETLYGILNVSGY